MTITTDSVYVLHVNDDEEYVEFVSESLERESDALVVETATSVREGVDLLAEGAFDCIVSGYDLNEKDGIDFLRRIRERHGDLPFVLVTDRGSEAVASEAISAGVTEYLRTESDTDQCAMLAECIETVVEEHRGQTDYHEIFDAATDGMLVSDPDTGEIIDANQRVTDMLGYDRDTLLDMQATDLSADGSEFTHEEMTRPFWAADAENTGRENTRQFDWRAETSDGTQLSTTVTLKTVSIDGRERLLATIREASEHQRDGWELDALGQFVETVGVGMAAYGDDGRFRYVNSEYAALFDTDPETLQGTPLWEINPDIERERFDDYWASFDDGETRSSETRHEFEGVEVPVQTVTTREMVRGTPYHFGTIQDVTERREREQEREVRSAAMEASIDGMAILDEDEEYRFVNQAHAEMYGYERTEAFLGESWDLCFPDKELDRIEAEVLPTLYENGAWRGEAVGERRDGTTFPKELSLTVTETGGIVGVVRDITDRVEREHELEQQNERLDEFASIVSHDLRNPLNVATGHLEMVRDDYESDHVSAVADAHNRMESLIDDLLGLARNDSVAETTETVSLPDTARRCWSNVRTHDATLVVETDRVVRATDNRVQQLLENLFRNAVEHGGDDVTVTVGTLDDCEGFYVEDDGPGLPIEDRERVFESGYSTEDGGTGLGLTIVGQIACEHDWDATVTEGTDGGMRIEITGVDSR